MAFLPRVGAIGLGLHRVSIRFIHPTYRSASRLLPRITARFASTDKAQSEKLDTLKEKCVNDPAHFKSVSASRLQEQKKEHMLEKAADTNEADFAMSHPIWSAKEANEVEITHEKPSSVCDWTAYLTVHAMRKGFDLFSGYTIKSYFKTLDERDMLRRCIFLETVAGVPGFAAAMVRHLQSLRRMQRDNGWIHTLLEEAENERMHLMTFLQLRKPGPLLRGGVAVTQIIFTGMFSLAYIISPHFCHR